MPSMLRPRVDNWMLVGDGVDVGIRGDVDVDGRDKRGDEGGCQRDREG